MADLSSIPPWLAFLLGCASGLLVLWLWSRARSARLEERLANARQYVQELQGAAEDAAAARLELGQLQAQRQADLERLAWIHTAEEQLRASFESLAGRLLESSTDRLLDRSHEQMHRSLERLQGEWSGQRAELKGLVAPVEQTLHRLGEQVQQLESLRQGAYEGLQREIALLRQAHGELATSATELRQALQSPVARGRWGEAQLRRVVELAGMQQHVDFEEQASAQGGLRPDLLVHLPQGAVLPIDAKVPLTAYLQSAEAPVGTERRRFLDAHLKAVRGRIQELGARAYWQQFERAPDFVVLFLPNDGVLAAAFERDPDLLEYALRYRVLVATPVTLLALLKTVAFGWQQQGLTDGARKIAELGRDLQTRLAAFMGHLQNLGKELDGSVAAYNRALGSLDRRVMPALRRLEEATASDQALDVPLPVERSPR